MDNFRTEHLRRVFADVTLHNGYAREVSLLGADVVITYRGRRMCRLQLSNPVALGAKCTGTVHVEAEMEVYDAAAASAFSRLWARDRDKTLSFTAVSGTLMVKIGSKKRKISISGDNI